MSAEVTSAIIAAGVSVVGGIASFYAQLTFRKRQYLHEERQSIAERSREADTVRSRYRDPLLASAYALQSRIFNIVERRLFEQPAETTVRTNGKSYATESTLYTIGEFLCWKEILRREIQFLDLGDDNETKRLNICFEGVMEILAQNDTSLGKAFCLFRMEQRAIGELMIETVDRGSSRALQAIGPAEFARRLNTPDFALWFEPVESALDELASRKPGALARLALLQNWIVEFIDQLDPGSVALAGKRRRLLVPQEFSHLAPKEV